MKKRVGIFRFNKNLWGDSVSIQTILINTIIAIMAIVSIDMLIYFVLSKRPRSHQMKRIDLENKDQMLTTEENIEEVMVIDVEFKGYRGIYTYGVVQQEVHKGQYVLVLTRDGIRCAKVITDSKKVRQSQLKIPPFLLENIICIADEVDLEYYN